MRFIKTRVHIFFAGLINLIIGTLPVAVPNFIRRFGGSMPFVSKNEIALDGLALVLGIVQLFIVYKMEGSPGMVFMGLRVRDRYGAPLTVRKVLMRSIPCLALLVAFVAMPPRGYLPILSVSIIVVAGGIVIFTACSGLVAFITGHNSIMDTLTKTKIAKIY
jgi:uncharacterized RDD family membrane protein YckC